MQELQCLGHLPVFILIVYHFAFFWRFYRNPYFLNTSEVASNFYPQWKWAGNHGFPMKDSIYYLFPGHIPFLSQFYPLSRLARLFSCHFRVYAYLILFHYLLGSFLAYLMLKSIYAPVICIFGAISLTYNGFNVKLQTPCFAFTSCWLMGALIPGIPGAFCFGMAILGGYWPIIVTFSPLLVINPSALWGVILGLPQIIPFLWYFPCSVRAKKRHDPQWGRMPWKRYFLSLTIPENGMIHYPEYSFGVGICAFLWVFGPVFYKTLSIFGLIMASSGLFVIDRIPARWVYLVSISLIMASLNAPGLTNWIIPAMVIQCFLLWKWRYQYPHFPFSQWWKKEHVYSGVDWPNNTGYMNGVGHQKYFGGFSLAENYRE